MMDYRTTILCFYISYIGLIFTDSVETKIIEAHVEENSPPGMPVVLSESIFIPGGRDYEITSGSEYFDLEIDDGVKKTGKLNVKNGNCLHKSERRSIPFK